MVRAEVPKCLTGPGSQSNGLVDEGDSQKPLTSACSENSKSWCSSTLSKGILSFVSIGLIGLIHENLDSRGSSNSGVCVFALQQQSVSSDDLGRHRRGHSE